MLIDAIVYSMPKICTCKMLMFKLLILHLILHVLFFLIIDFLEHLNVLSILTLRMCVLQL